jgi:hydrogenase expression/formation protein HypC
MCLAIPGKIVTVEPSEDPIFRMGKVSFDGVLREVNLSMVPEAGLDDYVLVHVGIALQVIDEEEAKKTLQYLKELDELNDLDESDKGFKQQDK